MKALFVKGNGGDIVALLLRGDHTLNAVKAQAHPEVATPLEFASEEQIVAATGCHPRFLGPVRLNLPAIADYAALAMTDFVCGANQDGVHYTGVNWETDAAEPPAADLRNIEEGETPLAHQYSVTIKRGIEVGHIFKLGARYSTLMKARVLNHDGQLQTMIMGCYGIGISRIVAAAIEQSHDDNGIVWPLPFAPFAAVITPIRYASDSAVRQAADALHQQLEQAAVEVLLDDRNLHVGAMLADADLIGIPYRIVISERSLRENHVEVKRRDENKTIMLESAQCATFLKQQIQERLA